MRISVDGAAGLARFRADFAASDKLTADELLLRPPRPAPRARREPKPRPARLNRPPPRWSRSYARAMSTRVIRDDRLTDGAHTLAVELYAQAGRNGEFLTTKLYLAARIGRSVRTIRRRLIELEALGYIEVHRPLSALGTNTGLLIVVTDLMRPFFELVIPGVPGLSPTKGFFKKKPSRETGYRPRKHRQSTQTQGPCPPRAATCPT
jgi:hypothetical protein